jgi:2-dehydropantoate 2-reductase
MGCVVEWGATMTEPGHCVLTTEPDALSFHMGKMDGITDEQVAMVKDLLEKMCPVHIEDNLMGARWSKLLINATFSGLGTVMGGTFGTVTGDKLGRKIAVRAMKECLDVGWAAGVEFAPVQGKNIAALFYYKNAVKKALSILLVPIAMKKHKNIEPSMLQDLRNGKACEVDAINGIVCDYGDKCRVQTPVNRRIVQIIKDKQAGKLPWDKNCIDMFRDLA